MAGPLKDPGSEVEGAQPQMNSGPGEGQQGTGISHPGENPGADVEGAVIEDQPNPGDAQGMDSSDMMKHAVDILGMGDKEGERGIEWTWRIPVIGAFAVVLSLFAFLLFGPPETVMGAFNAFVSHDSFQALACPSDAMMTKSPLVETGLTVPVSYSLSRDSAMLNVPNDASAPPSFFDVFFFDVFNTANSARMALGGVSFLPPGPCSTSAEPSTLETTPVPGAGVCGSTCSANEDCTAGYRCLSNACWKEACDATNPPTPGAGVCGSTCSANEDCKLGFRCLPGGECWQAACDAGSPPVVTAVPAAGATPTAGCYCEGTTYYCTGYPPAEFNPACGVGGGSDSTCNLSPTICRNSGLGFDAVTCTCAGLP